MVPNSPAGEPQNDDAIDGPSSSDDEVEDEGNKDDDSDEGHSSAVNKERRRIVAQSDSDEEVDDVADADVPPITNTQRQRVAREVDDLLDICSDSNTYGLAAIESIAMRAPATTTLCAAQPDDDVSESQLGDLCSGTFFTQAPVAVILHNNTVLYYFFQNVYR